MNSNQEQSQTNESQQSIIKKLLYNECPFNAQMSDYQKKLLLNENSRLTMQTAQKLLYQEQQGLSEYDTHSRKSEQKQRNRVGSSQFTDQKMVKVSSQQMNYISQNQQQNKNIWDELYEKGLKKKMMVELQMKQGEQEKIENETQDLTFQPKLVADNSSFNINQPFQERINNWQDAKNKRLAEIKKYYTESEDHRQIKECTFQPQILNKSRQITYEKIKKQQNENLYSNCESSQQTTQESQIKKNNMSSYKQINLTKQEFNKKKNILHNELQNLEIDL
ncbi:hypothetical protein ABPG74_000169 [Tetrahymena malaccensis]